MWILGLKGLRNRIPESGKFLLEECASQEIFACGILNPVLWNRNTTQGIRNPAKSRVQVPLTKIPQSSTWNPESMAWNQKSKSILDYLPGPGCSKVGYRYPPDKSLSNG